MVSFFSFSFSKRPTPQLIEPLPNRLDPQATLQQPTFQSFLDVDQLLETGLNPLAVQAGHHLLSELLVIQDDVVVLGVDVLLGLEAGGVVAGAAKVGEVRGRRVGRAGG